MQGISSAGARMRAAQGSADVRCTGVASAYGARERAGGDMRTKVTAIAEHTYMLTDRLTGVNQFLLEGKEKALLIDTGYGTKSLPRVVEKLTSLPVMVVNTHLHPDHSNGNGFFGKVMVGEPDLPSHGVPSNYIFEGIASAYRKSLLRPLMSVARKFALIDPSAAEYSPMPDMIHLGERSLDAVPCPGHTAGSVIFCDSETDFIFAGDAINREQWMFTCPSSRTKGYAELWKDMQEGLSCWSKIWISHSKKPLDIDFIGEFIRALETIKPENGRPTKIKGTPEPVTIYACESEKYGRIRVWAYPSQVR